MNILITGCDGFLGKEFSSYFSNKKYNLLLTNRDTLDVINPEDVNCFFNNNNVDIVLHTAIKGGRRDSHDKYDDFLDNLSMFGNLVANKNKFKLMINFGSAAEFDKSKNIESAEEARFLKELPCDYYGLSKNIIARQIAGIDDKIVNLRLFGCFGQNEHDFRMIKHNINRYKNKKSIIIHKDRMMDFFYVGDLCEVINHYVNVLGVGLPKDVNMSYVEKTSLLDIANIINKLDNHRVMIEIISDENEKSYTGDSTKLLSLDIPLKGVEYGIRRCYDQNDIY